MVSKPNEFVEFGSFRLDISNRSLWLEDRPADLPPKELELLTALAERPGEIVTKDDLLEKVWANTFVEESNISRHIYKLRRYFEEQGISENWIETVPRRGYRFTCPVSIVDGPMVIQRHSVIETTVEEIHDSEDPVSTFPTSTYVLQSGKHSRTLGRYAIGTMVLLAVTSLAFAAFIFPRFSNIEPPVRSIAVLPFAVATTSDVDPNLGSRVSDLLTARLSRSKRLKVRPTRSTLLPESETPNATSLLDRLNVDAIVEGTIENKGGALLINARLVRVSDLSVIWSEQFEYDSETELFLKDDLYKSLVTDLGHDTESASRADLTSDPEAMRMYMLGRYHWNKRDTGGTFEAARLFRNAIVLDPNFALAYVGIADTYIFGPTTGDAGPSLEKALELDPGLGEAYATRGFIKMFHSWSWDEAEADLLKSIELSPNHVPAHQWYGNLLMIRGRPHDAISALKRGLEIDPTSYNLMADLAQAHYYAGETEEAERLCLQVLENEDFIFAHTVLTDLYLSKGDYLRGIEHQTAVSRILSTPSYPVAKEKASAKVRKSSMEIFSSNGAAAYWSDIISQSQQFHPVNGNRFLAIARAQLGLGRHKEALMALDQAVEAKAFIVPFVNADPVWTPLRSEPRFRQIMAKMRL